MLLFDDGISVKAQKPERGRTFDLQERKTSQPQIEYGRRVLTDVVVVQTAPGEFEYVSAPMAADGSLRCSLVEVVQAKVQQVYGHRSLPLPLVVICDGASVIRQRWTQTFGKDVVIILDWYHLTKKLRNLMSMIASTKAEKLAHLKALFTHLWQGQSGAAINYLRQQVTPKNWEKWQELLTYLEKHKSELINYERRRQAGKSIGSGRVERQLIKSLPSVKSIKARVGDPKVAEHSAYSKSSNSTVNGTSSGFHNTCLTNQNFRGGNTPLQQSKFE